MKKKNKQNNPHLYASIKVTAGKEDDFIAKLDEAATVLRSNYGIALVGSFRDDADQQVFINVWSVPDDAALNQLMDDHSNNVITVTHELEALMDSEDTKVCHRVVLDSEADTSEDDWSVVLVAEDGKLYRLNKPDWENPTYQVTGDEATEIRTVYVEPNSILAKIPEKPSAFFACWFLNVRYLNLGSSGDS